MLTGGVHSDTPGNNSIDECTPDERRVDGAYDRRKAREQRHRQLERVASVTYIQHVHNGREGGGAHAPVLETRSTAHNAREGGTCCCT